VFKDVKRFSSGVRQEDDMTLVIMKLAAENSAD
jgi:serine phosphatase RsbU (regulator of sigma subunit)